MMVAKPFFLAGRARSSDATIEVLDKYSGQRVASVAVAGRSAIDGAIGAAAAATRSMRELPTFKRRQALEHVTRRMSDRAEEFAGVLVAEVGKPITLARAEVSRAIDTFRLSAEECGRVQGETLALDTAPRGQGYRGLYARVPVGACSLILPFNFPLNLLVHKVGPAIAAGCPFVAKPDPRTPLTALMLGEILGEASLPEGSWSILPALKDGIELFSEDERLKLLSFTGSPTVGWMLKARAGRKRVVLELGGNAACIVDEGANLDEAAAKITTGAFGFAGQSCISVQRIIALRSIASELTEKLVARARAVKVGDPRDEGVTVGPMIAEIEARRVEEWIGEAVGRGAKVLCGGGRRGSIYEPTLLTGVEPSARVSCQEVFGPVAIIQSVESFEEALRLANDSSFGLQCGVFTPSLAGAMRAFEELEVGGVIINDIPTWRMDSMPYGGVKQSGVGREGVRFAIEEMTEIRTLVVAPSGV
jgi:acyl-CoA reductase-like NAD-dependent aldehyde dehydrogenase